MNILFLGAGKRLSLLEYFQKSAEKLGVNLRMYSIERSKYVPIALVAEILEGPAFTDPLFDSMLFKTVAEKQIDMVIPLFDSACTALSVHKDNLALMGCRAVVSSHELCKTMEDKKKADWWFLRNDIPTPDWDKVPSSYPYIAKSRLGFGARDQMVIRNDHDSQWFWRNHSTRDYFLQPFIKGQEYTIDCFIAQDGSVKSILTRKRLEIEAGEVMSSVTHRNDAVIDLVLTTLHAGGKGFVGPLTFQAIVPNDDPEHPLMIEGNLRAGGGSTLAIACGQDYPLWLLEEATIGVASSAPEWRNGVLLTRCRRDAVFGC
jgi:carbamoyl-phosphate synthase large subunit